MAVTLTLRAARGRYEQQAAIDGWLQAQRDESPAGALAVISQGAWFDLVVPPSVPFARLAAGCVCCVGELPLRVTLARILRLDRPHAVLLLVTDATHLERLRAVLAGGELGITLEVRT